MDLILGRATSRSSRVSCTPAIITGSAPCNLAEDMREPVICARSTSPATKVSIAARVYTISALMPFLVKSPPTSATHNTPWLGETAEKATLTLSAAELGRAEIITSRTLNSRTGSFLMPDRDRGQNIMDPGRLFCVRRRFPKPSTAGFSRTIVESMSSVKHNYGQQLGQIFT